MERPPHANRNAILNNAQSLLSFRYWQLIVETNTGKKSQRKRTFVISLSFDDKKQHWITKKENPR